MSKVAIVTDSTASIPQPLLTQYKITAIPLTVIWGEEALQDGGKRCTGRYAPPGMLSSCL